MILEKKASSVSEKLCINYTIYDTVSGFLKNFVYNVH